MTSDFLPEVEIQPFLACVMHPTIIIGTVRSLWTWLWGRYHVPQNAFLVVDKICTVVVTRLDMRVHLVDTDDCRSILQCAT